MDGHASNALLLEAKKIEIAGRVLQRLAAGGENLRRPLRQFIDELARRQQKYAAVPDMLVAGQQALHRHQIRLLDEAGNIANGEAASSSSPIRI